MFPVLLVALLPLFTTLGVDALNVSDLPHWHRPEASCATQEVKAALTGCLSGATTACCEGLDAVFANSSSPSHGCLCYPQVLYKVLVTASHSGVEVLTLLNRCREDYGNSFQTQWAHAQPTFCPDIPVKARATQMIALMGDAVMLPSSQSRSTWSFRNLLQFGELGMYLIDPSDVGVDLFGVRVMQLLLVVILSTGPIFLFTHSVLLMRFPAYRDLKAADRMVVCQHSVYAVIFTLSIIPQTVLALRAMFKSWTGDYFTSWQLAVLTGVFVGSRAVLYLVEACVRSVIKQSPMLIIHHASFTILVILGYWRLNSAVLGMGIVLDWFAVMEFPEYWALLSYRLGFPVPITRALLYFACSWFVVTRVLQTVVVGYMVAGFTAMPHLKACPEFIITALLFGAFTFIQVYTLVIYRAIYRKVSHVNVKKSADQVAVVPCVHAHVIEHW